MNPPEPPSSLFPRLPAGHSAASPERAAAHRRGRLKGAMVAACARRGYGQVTIAELAALAGVSKRDFYASFASKEECFLAAFDEIVEKGVDAVRTAYRLGSDPRERLLCGVNAFAQGLVEHQDAMSMAIVDSLCLGTVALDPRQRAEERFAELMRQSISGHGEVSEITLRGIVGGLRSFAYRCLRDGRPEHFGQCAILLADWAMGYEATSGRVMSADLAQPPPQIEEIVEDPDLPGWQEPPASARSREALAPRERIVRAVARLAAAGGYASLTMPAIASAAAVSNRTFYREFTDKQDAFLAAFDALVERSLHRATLAFRGQGDWSQEVAQALHATLSFIAADPLFARLAFFELAAAGPAALDHADRAVSGFMAFLTPEALPPGLHPLPEVIVAAILGGIWTVIQVEIAQGHTKSLPGLAPQLTHFVLAPFEVA